MKAYDSSADTLKHIEKVRACLNKLIPLIIDRGVLHDKSKLETPEKEYFDKYTPKLADCTYLSDEYKRYLSELKPALDHHYANNRHHPEHFLEGIKGMDLIDLIEMVADWYAASLRHGDGNIMRSIELNKNRYKFDDVLANVLKNTALRFFVNDSELKG